MAGNIPIILLLIPLIKDNIKEEIASIVWTVSGKVKNIARTTSSLKESLEFWYDAMGNRISKKSTPKTGYATTTYYVRDASGNVMATYSLKNSTQFYLDELDIYGSSREGLAKVNELLVNLPSMDYTAANTSTKSTTGSRYYELANHLGNVLSVVSDRRSPVYDGSTITGYKPDIISATDYYPFGMSMSERSFSSLSYRYGFNGKEKDPEGMGGGGSTYDYGFRIYNPQIGKFLSVDPLFKDFPWWTPFQFAGNSPIMAIDLDGLEMLPMVTIEYAIPVELTTASRVTETIPSQVTNFVNSAPKTMPYNIPVPPVTAVPQTQAPTAGQAQTPATTSTQTSSSTSTSSTATGSSSPAVPIPTDLNPPLQQDQVIIPPAPAIPIAKTKVPSTQNVSLDDFSSSTQTATTTSSSTTDQMVKKGSKDLVREAEEAKAKKEAAKARDAKREAQTKRGNTRDGNSNQNLPGEHNTRGGGNKGGKHDTGNARRAKDQKVKGPDNTR